MLQTKLSYKKMWVLISIIFQVQWAYADSRTVMVHLFEWKWKDITKECKEFLGPAGFAGVQVSPPNEHVVIEGFPWYQRYQPVSYKIESRSGSREEFFEMVHECKKVGVDIYVDAVINHMTGVLPEGENKQGIARSPFSFYNYPGTYSYNDFHHCGRYGNDDIQNYSDRWEVQNCELVNLADLDTGADYVRGRIASYLSDLMSIGVAGFRLDAAKHMATDDIRSILNRLPREPYVYQEVIDQGGDVIPSRKYFQNGDVTEFKYGLDVSRIFREGNIAWFNGEHRLGEDWGYIPSEKAIVFIDNHDNQRGHGGGGHVLTHKDGRIYELASIFMLAWPYGYPQVMSSFAFKSQDTSKGPPSDQSGRTNDVDCLNQEATTSATDGWVCEHRWDSIAAMVGFRNATSRNFRVTDWWSNGKNQIAFGRGDAGFVVINNEDQELEQEYKTQLPAGRYCDAISRSIRDAGCSGQILSVDDQGLVRIKTKARSATVLYRKIF